VEEAKGCAALSGEQNSKAYKTANTSAEIKRFPTFSKRRKSNVYERRKRTNNGRNVPETFSERTRAAWVEISLRGRYRGPTPNAR